MQPDPDTIRKRYPILGSGEAYKQATKVTSIIHDSEKW